MEGRGVKGEGSGRRGKLYGGEWRRAGKEQEGWELVGR